LKKDTGKPERGSLRCVERKGDFGGRRGNQPKTTKRRRIWGGKSVQKA